MAVIRHRVSAIVPAAAVLWSLLVAPPAQAADALHSEKILFNGGQESYGGITYHSFRVRQPRALVGVA